MRTEPITIGFYALIATAALIGFATPVSPALDRALMRAHQLRPASTGEWLALQALPKMYSFAHRAWYSEEPIEPTATPPGEAVWVNHYPARLLRFDHARAMVVRYGYAPHLLLRSSYRGVELSSALTVRIDGRTLQLVEER